MTGTEPLLILAVAALDLAALRGVSFAHRALACRSCRAFPAGTIPLLIPFYFSVRDVLYSYSPSVRTGFLSLDIAFCFEYNGRKRPILKGDPRCGKIV